jgi:hypothetical protein
MSTLDPSAPETASERDRTARDERMLAMLKPGEQIWLLEEYYDQEQDTWRIDILRQEPQGNWLRQRYRYDTINRNMYYAGSSSVSVGELTQLRRNGRRMQGR